MSSMEETKVKKILSLIHWYPMFLVLVSDGNILVSDGTYPCQKVKLIKTIDISINTILALKTNKNIQYRSSKINH